MGSSPSKEKRVRFFSPSRGPLRRRRQQRSSTTEATSHSTGLDSHPNPSAQQQQLHSAVTTQHNIKEILPGTQVPTDNQQVQMSQQQFQSHSQQQQLPGNDNKNPNLLNHPMNMNTAGIAPAANATATTSGTTTTTNGTNNQKLSDFSFNPFAPLPDFLQMTSEQRIQHQTAHLQYKLQCIEKFDSIVPDVKKGLLLSEVPLLRGIKQSYKEKLGARMIQLTFQPGESIFVQGSQGEQFFIVISGTFHCYRSEHNNNNNNIIGNSTVPPPSLLFTTATNAPISASSLSSGTSIPASFPPPAVSTCISGPLSTTTGSHGCTGGAPDTNDLGRLVAVFSNGDYFGEAALLCAEPRSATVICAPDSSTPGIVLALHKHDFFDAMCALDISFADRRLGVIGSYGLGTSMHSGVPNPDGSQWSSISASLTPMSTSSFSTSSKSSGHYLSHFRFGGQKTDLHHGNGASGHIHPLTGSAGTAAGAAGTAAAFWDMPTPSNYTAISVNTPSYAQSALSASSSASSSAYSAQVMNQLLHTMPGGGGSDVTSTKSGAATAAAAAASAGNHLGPVLPGGLNIPLSTSMASMRLQLDHDPNESSSAFAHGNGGAGADTTATLPSKNLKHHRSLPGKLQLPSLLSPPSQTLINSASFPAPDSHPVVLPSDADAASPALPPVTTAVTAAAAGSGRMAPNPYEHREGYMPYAAEATTPVGTRHNEYNAVEEPLIAKQPNSASSAGSLSRYWHVSTPSAASTFLSTAVISTKGPGSVSKPGAATQIDRVLPPAQIVQSSGLPQQAEDQTEQHHQQQQPHEVSPSDTSTPTMFYNSLIHTVSVPFELQHPSCLGEGGEDNNGTGRTWIDKQHQQYLDDMKESPRMMNKNCKDMKKDCNDRTDVTAADTMHHHDDNEAITATTSMSTTGTTGATGPSKMLKLPFQSPMSSDHHQHDVHPDHHHHNHHHQTKNQHVPENEQGRDGPQLNPELDTGVSTSTHNAVTTTTTTTTTDVIPNTNTRSPFLSPLQHAHPVPQPNQVSQPVVPIQPPITIEPSVPPPQSSSSSAVATAAVAVAAAAAEYSAQLPSSLHHLRYYNPHYDKKRILSTHIDKSLADGHTIFTALTNNRFFQSVPKLTRVALTQSLARLDLDQYTLLTKQGETGRHLFILTQGTCGVSVSSNSSSNGTGGDQTNGTTAASGGGGGVTSSSTHNSEKRNSPRVTLIEAPYVLGEWAMLTKAPRTATIITLSQHAVVWTISFAAYAALAQACIHQQQSFILSCITRYATMFDTLSNMERKIIASNVELLRIPANQIIFLQHSTALDGMYILLSGKVAMYTNVTNGYKQQQQQQQQQYEQQIQRTIDDVANPPSTTTVATPTTSTPTTPSTIGRITTNTHIDDDPASTTVAAARPYGFNTSIATQQSDSIISQNAIATYGKLNQLCSYSTPGSVFGEYSYLQDALQFHTNSLRLQQSNTAPIATTATVAAAAAAATATAITPSSSSVGGSVTPAAAAAAVAQEQDQHTATTPISTSSPAYHPITPKLQSMDGKTSGYNSSSNCTPTLPSVTVIPGQVPASCQHSSGLRSSPFSGNRNLTTADHTALFQAGIVHTPPILTATLSQGHAAIASAALPGLVSPMISTTTTAAAAAATAAAPTGSAKMLVPKLIDQQSTLNQTHPHAEMPHIMHTDTLVAQSNETGEQQQQQEQQHSAEANNGLQQSGLPFIDLNMLLPASIDDVLGKAVPLHDRNSDDGGHSDNHRQKLEHPNFAWGGDTNTNNGKNTNNDENHTQGVPSMGQFWSLLEIYEQPHPPKSLQPPPGRDSTLQQPQQSQHHQQQQQQQPETLPGYPRVQLPAACAVGAVASIPSHPATPLHAFNESSSSSSSSSITAVHTALTDPAVVSSLASIAAVQNVVGNSCGELNTNRCDANTQSYSTKQHEDHVVAALLRKMSSLLSPGIRDLIEEAVAMENIHTSTANNPHLNANGSGLAPASSSLSEAGLLKIPPTTTTITRPPLAIPGNRSGGGKTLQPSSIQRQATATDHHGITLKHSSSSSSSSSSTITSSSSSSSSSTPATPTTTTPPSTSTAMLSAFNIFWLLQQFGLEWLNHDVSSNLHYYRQMLSRHVQLGQRSATCVAVEPTVLLRIRVGDIFTLLNPLRSQLRFKYQVQLDANGSAIGQMPYLNQVMPSVRASQQHQQQQQLAGPVISAAVTTPRMNTGVGLTDQLLANVSGVSSTTATGFAVGGRPVTLCDGQEPPNEQMRQLQEAYAQATEKRQIARRMSVASQGIIWENLRLVAILGRGAFGLVHLVKDVTTQRTYALKSVSKAKVHETRQQKHILNEKRLLSEVTSHPFIVQLLGTARTANMLHFVMEAALGGDLLSVLRHHHMLHETAAQFYSGCVLLALSYIHDKNIIYRDLKPENIVLEAKTGYAKLVDFGFAKRLTGGPLTIARTQSVCFTLDYLSPEMLQRQPYNHSVDCWAVGVLIYELCAGFPPFHTAAAAIGHGNGGTGTTGGGVGGGGGKPQQNDTATSQHNSTRLTYEAILHAPIRFPSFFSPELRDLLNSLFIRDPHNRAGCGEEGLYQVMAHPWFARFDWDALRNQTMIAPYKPAAKIVLKKPARHAPYYGVLREREIRIHDKLARLDQQYAFDTDFGTLCEPAPNGGSDPCAPHGQYSGYAKPQALDYPAIWGEF